MIDYFEVTVNSLSSVLSGRAAKNCVEEGLVQLGKTSNSATLEDYRKVLRASVYKRLQLVMPVAAAGKLVQEIENQLAEGSSSMVAVASPDPTPDRHPTLTSTQILDPDIIALVNSRSISVNLRTLSALSLEFGDVLYASPDLKQELRALRRKAESGVQLEPSDLDTMSERLREQRRRLAILQNQQISLFERHLETLEDMGKRSTELDFRLESARRMLESGVLATADLKQLEDRLRMMLPDANFDASQIPVAVPEPVAKDALQDNLVEIDDAKDDPVFSLPDVPTTVSPPATETVHVVPAPSQEVHLEANEQEEVTWPPRLVNPNFDLAVDDVADGAGAASVALDGALGGVVVEPEPEAPEEAMLAEDIGPPRDEVLVVGNDHDHEAAPSEALLPETIPAEPVPAAAPQAAPTEEAQSGDAQAAAPEDSSVVVAPNQPNEPADAAAPTEEPQEQEPPKQAPADWMDARPADADATAHVPPQEVPEESEPETTPLEATPVQTGPVEAASSETTPEQEPPVTPVTSEPLPQEEEFTAGDIYNDPHSETEGAAVAVATGPINAAPVAAATIPAPARPLQPTPFGAAFQAFNLKEAKRTIMSQEFSEVDPREDADTYLARVRREAAQRNAERMRADPLALKPGQMQSEQDLLEADANITASRLTARSEAAGARHAKLEAGLGMRAAQATADLAQKHLEAARLRETHGAATPAELESARLELERAQENLQAARTFEKLTSNYPDAGEPIAPTLRLDSEQLQSLLAATPRMLAARHAQERAELSLAIKNNPYNPQLEIQAARELVEMANERASTLSNSMRADLDANLSEIRFAQAEMNRLEGVWRKAADELRSTEERLSQGAVSVLARDDAHKKALQSEHAYRSSVHRYVEALHRLQVLTNHELLTD